MPLVSLVKRACVGCCSVRRDALPSFCFRAGTLRLPAAGRIGSWLSILSVKTPLSQGGQLASGHAPSLWRPACRHWSAVRRGYKGLALLPDGWITLVPVLLWDPLRPLLCQVQVKFLPLSSLASLAPLPVLIWELSPHKPLAHTSVTESASWGAQPVTYHL